MWEISQCCLPTSALGNKATGTASSAALCAHRDTALHAAMVHQHSPVLLSPTALHTGLVLTEMEGAVLPSLKMNPLGDV